MSEYNRLFDLNGDGKVDLSEELMARHLIFGTGEQAEIDSYTAEDELVDALEEAGIDAEEFIYGMDEEEREEALEAAGLDPDDFDDFDDLD